MSLLTLVQRAFKRVGLTAPTTAIGSTDENVLRMIELANEEGDELAARHDWQSMTIEETHTTLAAESQGLITAITGADFGHVKNDTFWNRTKNRRWYPLDDVTWQTLKASSVTGPMEYFRIRGNYLLALPVPPAGESLAFEWVTLYWCESSGGAGQTYFQSDADVPRMPESVMLQGLVWRWKKAQGLEYAEDFRQYEARLATAIMQDSPGKHLNMGSHGPKQGNVPQGGWVL